MSNLVVTNCEIGFIGGSVQHYNNTSATRFGNAIEIYGSVIEKNNRPVYRNNIRCTFNFICL